MPEKKYKVENEVYSIPEKEQSEFLKSFPDAEEMNYFAVGKDNYLIPKSEEPDFLKDNPQAFRYPSDFEPSKKKEQTVPTTLQSSEKAGVIGGVPTKDILPSESAGQVSTSKSQPESFLNSIKGGLSDDELYMTEAIEKGMGRIGKDPTYWEGDFKPKYSTYAKSPEALVNDVKYIDQELSAKYSDRISLAKTNADVEKLKSEYQKDIDDRIKDIPFIKKTKTGYEVDPEYIKDYTTAFNIVANKEYKKLAKSKEPEKGYFSSLFNKLGMGSYIALRDLSNTLDFFTKYKDLLGVDREDEADWQNFQLQQMEEKSDYYGKTMGEQWRNGEIGQLLGNAVLSIGEQAPLLASIAAGGQAGLSKQVIGAMSVGSGVSKYRDIKDVDVPEVAKIMNGIGTGLTFYALGELGGNRMINNAKELVRKTGIEEARRILTESYKSATQRTLEYIYQGVSPAIKGASIGGGTVIANNLIDKVTVDPERDISEGVTDAAITWALIEKGMTIHKDIARATDAVKIAKNKTLKDLTPEDFSKAVDLIMQKDLLVEQNKTLDESFQQSNNKKIEEINEQINLINQPRLVKEKINILNKEINNELSQSYPDINKVSKLESELTDIESGIKEKMQPEIKDIDKQIESLKKERDTLYEGKEELEIQKSAKREKEINSELSTLYKKKQAIKQKFYDEPLKGFDEPVDKEIYKQEKMQAEKELNKKMPNIVEQKTLKDENEKMREQSSKSSKGDESKGVQKEISDAVQIESPSKEMLRNEKPEVELQKMGEAYPEPKEPSKEGGKEKIETEEPIKTPPTSEIKKDFYDFANKIRKGKIDDDIAMAGVPFAKEVWNTAIETTAKTVELSGDVAQGIADGIAHIKASDWYKNLSEENRKRAEERFRKNFEEEWSGVKKEATEKIREELSLEDFEKPTFTHEEVSAKADELIQKGFNIESVLKKLETNESITPVENKILGKYISNLKAKFNETRSPEIEKELDRVTKISELAGRRAAQELASRAGDVFVEDNLYDYFQRKKEISGVDELTEQQTKDAIKEFEEIKAARDEYKQKVADLELKLKQAQIEKESKKYIRKNKTHEEFVKERKDILKDLVSAWKNAGKTDVLSSDIPYRRQLSAIAPHVIKLAGSYMAEGGILLKDVVTKIYNDLKGDVPDITERDIIDVIAGNHKQPKPTKQEVKTSLRDWQYEAKLITKLQDLLEGKEQPVKEKKKIERNQQIKELKEQIKDFQQATKLATGDKKELIALKSLKTRAEKNIKKYQEQIEKGDFSKPEKPVPILDNKEVQKKFPKEFQEALDAKDKEIRLRAERDVKELEQMYERRTNYDKAKDLIFDVLGIPKSLMASIDFSAPFVQGSFINLGHPMMAARAFKEMFQQTFSEKNYQRWLYDLKDSPMYETIRKSGLDITDVLDPRLSKREEMVHSTLADRIPGIKILTKAGGRAYSSHLNKLRVDMFSKLINSFASDGKTFKNNPELYKAAADYVNYATGRGSLGKFEKGAELLSQFIWSPKMMVSRFRLLTNPVNPAFWSKVPNQIKIQYFKDLSRFIAGGSTLIGGAVLASTFNDDISVEKDPRSSDFVKIVIGNNRYDTWGGFTQYLRLFAQIWTGERKSAKTKEISKLGEKWGSDTKFDVLVNFFRSKAAPLAGLGANILEGKTMTGEEFDIKNEYYKYLLPLWMPTAYEAAMDGEIKDLFTVGVPNIFGIGAQVYSDKEENNKTINNYNKKLGKTLEVDTDYILLDKRIYDANKTMLKAIKEGKYDEAIEKIRKEGYDKDLIFMYNNETSKGNPINKLDLIIKEIAKQPEDVQKRYKYSVKQATKNFVEAYKIKDTFEIPEDLLDFYDELSEEKKEILKEGESQIKEFLGI